MSETTKPMRVDAHQHFWQYTHEEFGWIDDTMSAIRRDFLPADLLLSLREAAIDATVAVQARQSVAETEWLLELACENPWIEGVVGWAPLASPEVAGVLDRITACGNLKAVRHVLQGEPDEYMEQADFNRGVALLEKYCVAYDLLIQEHQLPAAIQLVDRHPHQLFVLDHVAKPLIAMHQIEPWARNMRELARRPHVVCKLSGMVTEANCNSWTVDDLRPYFEIVLEAFGPRRLLYGSDWPVCTVASSYDRWVTSVSYLLSDLSSDEQAAIFGGNAVKVYRLRQSGNAHEVESA